MILNDIIKFIVETIGELGYIGIFIMMFLESSFFPFPSEVVMIPAGYLASKGEMNLLFSIILGILGSISGALFNYYIAYKFGRPGVLKFGKYFFFNENKLKFLETFFDNHGHISTFTGRLVPGIRQYISLPAGLAKMNIFNFILYTTLGAGIWVIILTFLGYFIGENQNLIHKYLHEITFITIFFVIVILFLYFIKNKKRKKSEKNIS